MLDKDHKSRIDLDGIVEDDWVTHEGVDPFFFDGNATVMYLFFVCEEGEGRDSGRGGEKVY